ncbi:MAG: hypothetical protein WCF03_19335 [Nitrososphaeraceae archaeon]
MICNTRLNYWERQDPAIMNRQKLRIAILAGILLTATALASGAMSYARGQTSTKSTTTVVRDSSAVLLDGKTIPAIDYIHLYDATPYKIMSGHVAAKLPCDTNSVTPLKMLVGQAPNLKSASLALIKELSTPGSMCLYHYDIPQGGAVTTDLALQNPTKSPIKLPDTSTVVIGVNEIMPLAEQSSMMMGNTTK